MFGLNKIFVAVLISLVALVSFTKAGYVYTNPSRNIVTLIELSDPKQGLGTLYKYKCIVGMVPNHGPTYNYSGEEKWEPAHDVAKKLRCPVVGNAGVEFERVEIVFSANSRDVDCLIHEGGIGSEYIGLTINVKNTTEFRYSAAFYVS